MNHRTVPILITVLAVCLSFVRCAREVIIDWPEEEAKIVTICHFTAGQPFKVRVSLSQPVYDTRAPIVPAKVDVTVAKEGAFLDKLFEATDDNGNLYWESRDLAEQGVPYSITVRYTEFPAAEAASSIPVFSPLEPIRIVESGIKETPLGDGRRLLSIPLTLKLKNLPPEKRFFAFYLKHDLDVGEFVDGEWVTDFTYEGLATNYAADGRSLALWHDLEAEPLVMVNEKFWSDNRDSIILDARIAYNPAEHEKPRRIYVEWRTLSEEFYKYHLSLDRQGSTLPLSDPDAVYNNVLNGYGNFSGYSVQVDTVELPL